jgi:hypothetical protein
MILIDFIYGFSASDLLFNYHFPALQQHERSGAYKAKEVSTSDSESSRRAACLCVQVRCKLRNRNAIVNYLIEGELLRPLIERLSRY